MSQQRYDIIPTQDEKFLTWGNRLIESMTPEIGVADETVQDLRTKMTELSELSKRVIEMQTGAKQVYELKKTARQEVEKQYRAEICQGSSDNGLIMAL